MRQVRVRKRSEAQEVREQKLREAQDISEAVLDAEVKIGELMAKVQKAKGGQPFHEKRTSDTAVESRPQTKSEVIKEAGLTQKQVERFQTLAAHPEIVEKAKAEAQEMSEALIDAKVRLGELLNELPKAKGNQYTSANSTHDEKAKSKSETIAEMGLSKDQVSQLQQLAENPEVVEEAKAEARKSGDVVSQSEVRIGKMLKEMPKVEHTGNQYTKEVETSTVVEESKPKTKRLHNGSRK